MKGRIATLVALTMFFATACTSGTRSNGSVSPTTATSRPGATFMVIGTSASTGDGLVLPLQYAWPRLVFRQAFPRTTVFVNAAVSGSSAENALREQVPLVEQLHPTVVVIWLGAVEVSQLVPVAEFKTNLRAVVDGTRATGARVLLADLPTYPTTDVRPYNAVIDGIARDTGVALVPLRDVKVTWIIPDPFFLPNINGNRAIAAAIEASLSMK
jgi:acyl-CoA thioesterase-1